MHYTYYILVGASLVTGVLLKYAYDKIFSHKDGDGSYVFKRVDNKNRKFGEDPWYNWVENTEYGNLAFTDEDIEKAAARGRKQVDDLKVDGKPFSPPRK